MAVPLKLDLQRRSRRLFSAEYETYYNATYFSSKRIGPSPKKVDFDQFQNLVVLTEGNMNDFLWVFLRRDLMSKQVIPSWTGFNIILHDGRKC